MVEDMQKISDGVLMEELMEKYERLVWYARKSPELIEMFPQIQSSIQEIEALYPEETDALNTPDAGDWQHGFNSGMLAALRLIIATQTKSAEQALKEFPNLDT